MSTKERYSILVAEAVMAMSYLVEPSFNCFLAVGEVAEKAGVSKPTAAKYLEQFKDDGHLSSMKIGRQKVYRLLVRVED